MSPWEFLVGAGAAVGAAAGSFWQTRSAKRQDEEGWDWLRLWAESVDGRLDELTIRLDRHIDVS